MDSEFQKRVECRYSQRQCNKTVIEGYQLCRSHILEDKDSPFQQCGYVSAKTGRRCVQATLNSQKKEGLCLQHTTKLNRSKRAAAKKQLTSAPITVESTLQELKKYIDGEHPVKPGTDSRYDSVLAELASSEDSDIEERHYPADAHLWQPDSDSESIDSESEDIFKYAEVFTAEEVTRIARDKLIRLQSLYIEQFKWLQNMLRERRREYLLSKSSSDESNTEGAAADTVPYSKAYKEYQAIKRYHKRHGRDALMYMKSQERRKAVCNPQAAEGSSHNRYRHASRHGTKYCSAKSVKCHEKSLPFARHCLSHIESDRKQALFRRCGFEAVWGGLSCERVVVDVDEQVRCSYHSGIDTSQCLLLKESGCTATETSQAEANTTTIENIESRRNESPLSPAPVDPVYSELSQTHSHEICESQPMAQTDEEPEL